MPDRPDLHNDDKPDYLCDLQNSSAIHVKLEVGISQGNRNFGKEGMLTGTVKAILRESECLVKRSTASKGSWTSTIVPPTIYLTRSFELANQFEVLLPCTFADTNHARS